MSRSHVYFVKGVKPSFTKYTLSHLIFRISNDKRPDTQMGIWSFGDPLEIRTPDPLLKRQSPDSQGWGEPKTCCCSSTFRSSVFCVYVTRPTAYPVFYYNQKNGIRQTFLSINRYLILEINYSKAIFNRDDKMFRKTLLPDTNIFLTTAEVPFCGTQGRRHLTLLYEAFASFFLCPSQITSHPNTTDSQKSII